MGKFRSDSVCTGSGCEIENREFLLFFIVWRAASVWKLSHCSNETSSKDFIKCDILNYVFMLKCGLIFILLSVQIGLYMYFG